jgi:sugar lactone lactonase YvrE
VLEYGSTGKLLAQIVKNNDPNAPQSPQGMILLNGSLFVADIVSPPTKSITFPPGTLRKYTASGVFLGAFVAGAPYGPLFHPRAVVLGPDGLLYVTNAPNLVPPSGSGLGGQVFRFNPDTGAFVDTYITDPGGTTGIHLNRPQGIVFGPDGRIYITSFRGAATDNDKIMIYQGNTLVDHIDLDIASQSRSFAQALLFGPDGKLFVPINNTGEIRRYDVISKSYDVFVPAGGELDTPWFLSFGATNPGTLKYP